MWDMYMHYDYLRFSRSNKGRVGQPVIDFSGEVFADSLVISDNQYCVFHRGEGTVEIVELAKEGNGIFMEKFSIGTFQQMIGFEV